MDEDEKEEEKTRTREKRLVGKRIPHRNSSSTSSTCQKKNSGSRVFKRQICDSMTKELSFFHRNDVLLFITVCSLSTIDWRN